MTMRVTEYGVTFELKSKKPHPTYIHIGGLENAIAELIKEFEKDTGWGVKKIELYPNRETGQLDTVSITHMRELD